MNNMIAGEHELAVLIEQQQNNQLATWSRQRTLGELSNFVERRMALLEDAL